MPRTILNLQNPGDLRTVGGLWRYAPSLVSQLAGSPALLAINGPLAAPGGAVFVHYATLAFE